MFRSLIRTRCVEEFHVEVATLLNSMPTEVGSLFQHLLARVRVVSYRCSRAYVVAIVL